MGQKSPSRGTEGREWVREVRRRGTIPVLMHSLQIKVHAVWANTGNRDMYVHRIIQITVALKCGILGSHTGRLVRSNTVSRLMHCRVWPACSVECHVVRHTDVAFTVRVSSSRSVVPQLTSVT